MAQSSNAKNSNGTPAPIQRQIATSADYYGPAVYAGARLGNDLPSLLTFYRDLVLTADPAASGFVPMSAVPSRGRNTKLFAVGIIPPSILIDDTQLLDRSATVARLTGGVTVSMNADKGEDEAAINAAKVEEIPYNMDSISIEEGQSRSMDGRIFRRNQAALNSLHESMRSLAVRLVEEARRQGILIIITEGFRSVERQNQLYAQGRGDDAGKGKIVTGAKGGESWHQYGLAFDIAIAGSSGNPVWPPNDDLWNTIGAIGENLGMTWGGRFSDPVDRPHFEYHPGFGIPQALAGQRPAIPSAEPVPLKADADSAVFAGYGSRNANEFKRQVARQVDLIQVDLLNNQRSYLQAIKSALQAMINTPPLRLLVNPNTFSVKSQKIVSDANWGRTGPIIEFWGDDQDKISGSGQVAAFYALDAFPQLGRGGPGLTRHARNLSMAWQNFQSLYLLYRNNGGMYLSDLSQQDKDVLLTTVGSIYIFYDNILYIGCFDSFNVSEADQKPFTVEYSFEFTVRAAFVLEFASDFSYGGAAAFRGATLGDGLPTVSGTTSSSSLAEVASFGTSVVESSDVQGTIDAATDVLLGSI